MIAAGLHQAVTKLWHPPRPVSKVYRRKQRGQDSLLRFVVDQLGYLSLDQRGAEPLFGLVSHYYEQVSLIVTTNLPFVQWLQTLAGGERMIGALLDRLTHRVEILAIEGDSYRLRESLDAKLAPKKT